MQKVFWEQSAHKSRRSASHPVVSLYSCLKLNLIFEKLEYKSISNVLDIGCGNGFFTVPLNDKFNDVIGLDFSHLMLSFTKREVRSLIHADSLHLPFKDSCFDLIFSANLLHHVDNIELSIIEMKRVSKKYIVIIKPNKQNPIMYFFAKLNNVEDVNKMHSLNELKVIIEKKVLEF